MNRLILIIIVFMHFFFSGYDNTNACTAFCLIKNGESVLLCKNFDWSVGHGFVVINRRGIKKSAFVDNELSPAKWTSKFGSITFNQFGKEFPLGGMNEAGLIVEELSYSPTKYPKKNNVDCINELQWIQYQLDNYSTVEEVIYNISQTNISKMLSGLHFIICDKEGRALVVEFIDKDIFMYAKKNLPYPVLVNNSYSNSLKYLEYHKGFGGKREVSSGDESPERFVKAATAVENLHNISEKDQIDYAFESLSNVQQNDTQWSIVYDAIKLKIFFRTKNNDYINSIDLQSTNYLNTSTQFYSPIDVTLSSEDVMKSFINFSISINNGLLDIVFDDFSRLGEIDSNVAHLLKKKLQEYQRPYIN